MVPIGIDRAKGRMRRYDRSMTFPSGGPWTPKELKTLRDAFARKVGKEELSELFPRRSYASITMQAARLGIRRETASSWTPIELETLEEMALEGASWDEIAEKIPAHSKDAIRERAYRDGFERGYSEYMSASRAAKEAATSVPTMVSIIRYAELYRDPVRTKPSKDSMVYHREDLRRAILEWIDLQTLRQYANSSGVPYSTLQNALTRMGVRFKESVEQGHRKLRPTEWESVFQGKPGPEALMEISSSPTEPRARRAGRRSS